MLEKPLGCKLLFSLEENKKIVREKFEKFPEHKRAILKKVQALIFYWKRNPMAYALYEYAKELLKEND